MQDRADKRKYHFIYKTTNVITNKFYIGMHSTNKLEDGYIGSGKRLWYSINKYGKENHKCEILEFVEDRKLLAKREAEIVTEEFLLDPLCLNLKVGGSGGFWSKEHQIKCSLAGCKTGGRNKMIQFHQTAPTEEIVKNASKGGNSTKEKFGNKNPGIQSMIKSNLNMMWITDGIKNVKVDKTCIIPSGWRKGRIGNFINKKFIKE